MAKLSKEDRAWADRTFRMFSTKPAPVRPRAMLFAKIVFVVMGSVVAIVLAQIYFGK